MDLTPRQRLIFWILTVLCAVSRFMAMARSMWDWDEALFCLGMREYDVTRHHPHPPGFPVYIGMAKIVRLVVPSDFRALQLVNLIAGVLVFPAIFLLARELRLRFETSIIAAALFAFLPNVWFFGGTAFSDIPSIVLVVFAVVFLLRGRNSRRDYWLGTFLLALSIGIRPQNVLVGLFPGALATMRRSWREVTVAILIGVLVVGISFGAAIYATGSIHDYMTTVRAHGDYIARIDSFRAPERPPLWRLFDRFFLKQYQSPPLSVVMSIFVAISIAGAIVVRDRAMLYNFLIFGPFAISAWLMLDRFSINRFSIGYAPMFAIFAADGIARVSRGNRLIETGIGAAIVAAFFIWTAPALPPVRRDVAPSVRAVDAALQTTGQLFVGYSMTPFIEYLAPQRAITRVMDDRAVPLTIADHPILLAEVSEPQPGGTLFTRERDRLWNIARRHYFEVVLRPLTNIGQFGEGWSPPEQQGMDEWRWMGSHSVTTLPRAQGDTVLRLHFVVPTEIVSKQPNVTVTLNGKTLDRFRATEEFISRDYHVTPAMEPNVLELSTDQTLDKRGLKVRFISWGPG
ncbi:MAG TPA: glycosyltransferase family 39 protein [Thermoanaerobaculia bacterium]